MESNTSSLKSYNWKPKYKSKHGNLVNEFLIPALERSIIYRRVAGFFSSTVLKVAAAGIAKLLMNGGEMELIIGADLSEEDVNAINKGEKSIGEYIQDQINIDLDDYDDLERFIANERYKALYWLISKRRMTIKVALVIDEDGILSYDQNLAIFHDKWGIFIDSEGDILGFNGSTNESEQAWLKNHESFHTYKGWTEEWNHLEEDIRDFQTYWNDNEPGIRVYDISEAIEQKLIRYRKFSPPTQDPMENQSQYLYPLFYFLDS